MRRFAVAEVCVFLLARTSHGFLQPSRVSPVVPLSVHPTSPIGVRSRSLFPRRRLLRTKTDSEPTRTDEEAVWSGNGLVRVAFQGEPGAYSEKACRELLGDNIVPVGKPSFEDAFKAVSSREVEFGLLPIENSLGGSIHNVYDLLVRYNLYIVAEHTLRVRHCLLAMPGTKKSEVTSVYSHPQALAQCDNYLRRYGMRGEPSYDTAGSAKRIRDEEMQGCAAIASDLAASIYNLDILQKGIEDDDNNFTRFLLLSRRSVGNLIPPNIPAKTTLFFLMRNGPGSLFRALACFALRDLDLSKCESRPSSVQLRNFIKYARPLSDSPAPLVSSGSEIEDPFAYCFYLDIKASISNNPSAQAAVNQLKEQSEYVRVLGCYPESSELIGPVKNAVDIAASFREEAEAVSSIVMSSITAQPMKKLKVAVIGFGVPGQRLASLLGKHADVVAVGQSDQAAIAEKMGIEFIPKFQLRSVMDQLDVLVVSVGAIHFEKTIQSLAGDLSSGKLVVDLHGTLKSKGKQTMLRTLPKDCDILSAHMFLSPESSTSWQGQPVVYDQVRVSDAKTVSKFLSIFEDERCQTIEMAAEKHDGFVSKTHFISTVLGHALREQNLQPSPVDTTQNKLALKLAEISGRSDFDDFYGLFKDTPDALALIASLKEAIAVVERKLMAREMYLSAQAEFQITKGEEVLLELRRMLTEYDDVSGGGSGMQVLREVMTPDEAESDPSSDLLKANDDT
eukprot:CAMPEP_0185748434 /NCGR_PEP_ID=MMETSP1174-20130828/7124_1 /TAXON_ID=35687 /ORGANISM="Dictyocha speculum, Strain CCMP1381" /LENGTH=731 /DNA_ID=CAMNT_0028424107 /DNA_START=14 /DNA_END=2210 /DNA_ORIENTATION=+